MPKEVEEDSAVVAATTTTVDDHHNKSPTAAAASTRSTRRSAASPSATTTATDDREEVAVKDSSERDDSDGAGGVVVAGDSSPPNDNSNSCVDVDGESSEKKNSDDQPLNEGGNTNTVAASTSTSTSKDAKKDTEDNSNDVNTTKNDDDGKGKDGDRAATPVVVREGGRASPILGGVEVNMTNMTNNSNINRPASAASMHSNGSVGGGPAPSPSPISRSTTATSRRGRSRSPTAGAMGRSSPITASPSSRPFPAGTGPSISTAVSSSDGTTAKTKEGKDGPDSSPSASASHQDSSSKQGSTSSGQSSTTQPGRSTQGGSQQPPATMAPANPSAAAAAAAAAAKSLHRSQMHPPPPTTWYGGDPQSAGPGPHSKSSRYGGAPPPPSGGSSSASRRGTTRPSSRYSPGSGLRAAPASYYDSHHSSQHGPAHPSYYDGRPPSRGGGPQGERYGYRSGSSGAGADPYSYRSGSSGRSPYGGPPPPHHYDEYGRRPYGGPPPPPLPPHQQPPSRPHSATGGQSTTHTTKTDSGGSSTPSKPTRRVIGTATPIHVPRAAEQHTPASNATKAKKSGTANSATSSSKSDARRGSAASVFRRSNSGTGDAEKKGSGKDENPQQQKILMALESPSNSFEEKKSSQPDPGIALSPREPPQIHRSPAASPTAGPPQPTNSLEMAPSFSLFNQSFDSLGDAGGFFNVGSTLESALQSTSFGGAGSLDEKTLTDLQLTASGGTFKLGASSSGGALTFGMSPTNSFGNGAPVTSTRGGNIFLLGGQETSHVLDIYRTNSVSSPRGKTEEGVGAGNLRLSGSLLASPSLGNYSMRGSFGAEVPMMPQHQGYHPPPPHHLPIYHRSDPYHHRPRRSTAPAPDGAPGFYVFLRKHRRAFLDVTFLLPGLKAFVSKEEKRQHKKDDKTRTPKRKSRDHPPYDEPTEQESVIAQRRVVSAICAFGGTFMGSRISDTAGGVASGKAKSSSKTKGGAQSIFRNKRGDPAAVTPQSSESSSSVAAARQQAKYDEALPGRYYENDNRLSWEFEENPPVGESSKDEKSPSGRGTKRGGKSGNNGGKAANDPSKKQKIEHDDQDDGSGDDGEGESKKSSDKGKMKYRCKLCGQPKTDHVCPYKQSLVRSIGAMVYPAVNAFTAIEPGKIAPCLSEMNNFVIDAPGQPLSAPSAESSPTRPTPDRSRRGLVSVPSSTMAQVTPEALRSGTPRSSTASHESAPTTPQHGSRNRHGPGSAPRNNTPSNRLLLGDGPSDQTDLLFVEATDLNPEQFRMVTQSKALAREDAFTYPALPLPYAQRKRLSDNLFSLSKEIPQLTDECAAVLREARERDLWDLAVAELMTQVVIVCHCHDNDMVFEGLRRYMLSLGISC